MRISDYLQEYFDKMQDFRASAGYATTTYRVTIVPFIDFCCGNYPEEKSITKEMLDAWLVKKNYSVNTQASFIACLRQYCKYINFLGTKCYIPNEDYTLKRISYEPNVI